MENFEHGSLKITQEKADNKTVMSWTGISDERTPENYLIPYLESVVNKWQGGDLVIEFRKFEYMNSSTVVPIIRFVQNLDKKNIKTSIYYNKELKWQIASFKALETITMNMSNIKIEGK